MFSVVWPRLFVVDVICSFVLSLPLTHRCDPDRCSLRIYLCTFVQLCMAVNTYLSFSYCNREWFTLVFHAIRSILWIRDGNYYIGIARMRRCFSAHGARELSKAYRNVCWLQWRKSMPECTIFSLDQFSLVQVLMYRRHIGTQTDAKMRIGQRLWNCFFTRFKFIHVNFYSFFYWKFWHFFSVHCSLMPINCNHAIKWRSIFIVHSFMI